MKALEFLQKLKESRDFDGNIEYRLDEAIAEIEELQEKITELEEPKNEEKVYAVAWRWIDHSGYGVFGVFTCGEKAEKLLAHLNEYGDTSKRYDIFVVPKDKQ